MMKCKFHCLNFSPYKIFRKMENNNGSNATDRCSCEDPEDVKNDNCPEASTSKDKKTKIGLFSLCKDKSKRGKKSPGSSIPTSSKSIVKKSPKWSIKFNCAKRESKSMFHQGTPTCCRCTCYQHAVEHTPATGIPEPEQNETSVNEIYNSNESCNSYFRRNEPIVEENPQGARGIYSVSPATSSVPPLIITAPLSNMHRIRNHEDCDEAARMARAREIEQGVEAPANFRAIRRVQLLCSDLEPECNQGGGPAGAAAAPRWLQLVCPPDLSVESLRALFQNHVTLKSCPPDTVAGCHTQVDFIHCLVPDLLTITNCSFYWGKMDRYEAERLLEGKPEGTFLLRDSAQEEFLFSVSFRKYGRSLHARIEQWNHKFSFDSHDPGVYTSNTVCGLIEHYKDPSSCMFFEPVLTLPLHRKFTFSLQHLSRAAIVSKLTYDSINQLQLPKTLKTYLKEYHYRQKVRVEIFDDDMQWLELRNMPT